MRYGHSHGHGHGDGDGQGGASRGERGALTHPQFGTARSVAARKAAHTWAAVALRRSSMIWPITKTLHSFARLLLDHWRGWPVFSASSPISPLKKSA